MGRHIFHILLVALLFLAPLGGCAYGYAGQEGKSSTEPETRQNVQVVELDDSEGDSAEGEAAEPAKTEPESPCGARTFAIFYFDGESRVEKTIDCLEREVADVRRSPIEETSYVDAKAAGLPEGVWYLLVDPKGVRTDFLDNAHLLRLSRQFEIEYYGRDASRDLLVYLYQDSVK